MTTTASCAFPWRRRRARWRQQLSPRNPLEPRRDGSSPRSTRLTIGDAVGVSDQPPDAPHGRVLRRERSVERHGSNESSATNPKPPRLCARARPARTASRPRSQRRLNRRDSVKRRPTHCFFPSLAEPARSRETFAKSSAPSSCLSFPSRDAFSASGASENVAVAPEREINGFASVSQLVLAAAGVDFAQAFEFRNGQARAARGPANTKTHPTSSVATFESETERGLHVDAPRRAAVEREARLDGERRRRASFVSRSGRLILFSRRRVDAAAGHHKSPQKLRVILRVRERRIAFSENAASCASARRATHPRCRAAAGACARRKKSRARRRSRRRSEERNTSRSAPSRCASSRCAPERTRATPRMC